MYGLIIWMRRRQQISYLIYYVKQNLQKDIYSSYNLPMKQIFPLFIIILTLLSGCASIHKSYPLAQLHTVIRAPIDADISVDTSRQLVGYSYVGYLFHIIRIQGGNKYAEGVTSGGLLDMLPGANVGEAKALAVYNAMQGSNAEILVYPKYVIEENHLNPFWKSIKVKVTGYPGKVVNLR